MPSCRGGGGGTPARSGAPRPEHVGEAASQGRGGRAGSAPIAPGTKTSSSRFASATTAMRGRSKVEWIASSAAASWPLPAVDHDEVRDLREALVVALGRRRVPQPGESPRDDLRHRSEVVLPLEPAHGERPVVRSALLCVDEHRHRRDDLAALDVRHVEALDPGRQALEVERLAELLERLDPPSPPLLGRRTRRARARAARSPPPGRASRRFSPRCGARTSTRAPGGRRGRRRALPCPRCRAGR